MSASSRAACIARSCWRKGATIDVADIEPTARLAATRHGGGAPGLVGRTMAEVEQLLIVDTLRHTLGNRTHAATILGISIRTLRNKLREYGDAGIAVPPPARGERAA